MPYASDYGFSIQGQLPETDATCRCDRQMTDTPFMRFWAVMNDERRKRMLPELTFGPARELFAEAVRKALME